MIASLSARIFSTPAAAWIGCSKALCSSDLLPVELGRVGLEQGLRLGPARYLALKLLLPLLERDRHTLGDRLDLVAANVEPVRAGALIARRRAAEERKRQVGNLARQRRARLRGEMWPADYGEDATPSGRSDSGSPSRTALSGRR